MTASPVPAAQPTTAAPKIDKAPAAAVPVKVPVAEAPKPAPAVAKVAAPQPASVTKAPVAPPAPAAKPAAAAPAPTLALASPPTTIAAAGAASLGGHVQLVVGAGQNVDADEVTDGVVYFVPTAGAPHPKPGRFQIFTRDKVFDPSSLVVPLGSVVSFPNQDEILHNVFSASPGAEFDLGLYGEGKSAEVTFKKAGLIVINCNVHHVMQANVLVVDTPYFAHVAKNGDFHLAGVPAGPGKLMLWHPRGTLQTLEVASAANNAISLQLVVSKPRVVAHLNKERKQYQPSRD